MYKRALFYYARARFSSNRAGSDAGGVWEDELAALIPRDPDYYELANNMSR